MENNIEPAGPLDIPVRGRRLTKKQKRMKKTVAWLTEYMQSYDKQSSYLDYADTTFIDDVLYGLGVSLHGSGVAYAQGYEKWKQMLRDHLGQATNAGVER